MEKEVSRKLKSACNNFLGCLAGHPLFAFVTIFLIVLALGGGLFYKYGVLAERAEPKAGEGIIQFRADLYQQILKDWQERQERFQSAGSQQYLNPFQEKRLTK